MEIELGLKRPMPRNVKAGQIRAAAIQTGHAICGANVLTRRKKLMGQFAEAKRALTIGKVGLGRSRPAIRAIARPKPVEVIRVRTRRPRRLISVSNGVDQAVPMAIPKMSREALIAWAWKNGRTDVLALFGIYANLDP